MLAALRQSGLEYHYDYLTSTRIFDYEEEVKTYREAEHDLAQQEERWEIERSWL